MKNTHTQQKRAEMKIQLERTNYYQAWVEPTLSDLLAIENRAERNKRISAELVNLAREVDTLNLDPSTYCDLLS
jgi:hypothetical protein